MTDCRVKVDWDAIRDEVGLQEVINCILDIIWIYSSAMQKKVEVVKLGARSGVCPM